MAQFSGESILTRRTKDKAAQLYAFCRVLDDPDGDITDGAARLSS